MSFFAVLDNERTNDRTGFAVTRLHLNLWSLAALGVHRRMFVLDVGMVIKANRQPVEKLTIALPFDTLEPSSLHDKVRNPKLAELIFDGVVTNLTDKSLTYGDSRIYPLEINARAATRVAHYTAPGFSLWDIPLTRAIPRGKEAYVRLRFPIAGTGRTWQWTRAVVRRSGAILDFRINDIRASAQIPGGAELIDRMRPIDSVAAFVMAPVWLHGRTLHPEPRYIRLLEGRVWADYLDRAPEILRRSRLVVYYWRNDKSDDGKLRQVTVDKPMRAFAEFKIDAGRSWVPTAVLSALLSVILAWVFFPLGPRQEFVDAVQATGRFVTEFSVYIWLAVGLSVFAWIARFYKWGMAAFNWVRNVFHRAEATFFRALRTAGPRD